MSVYDATRSKISLRIDGATTACEALVDLEFAARRRVVSAAVRAANSVVVKKAKELAPVGKTGLLKKQIRGTVKLDRVSGRVYAYIRSAATKKQRTAGGASAARYSHLVIGGTKPHEIQRLNAAGLTVGGQLFSRVQHPGAKPREFMEQAADQSFREALAAFGTKFDERLGVERNKIFKAQAAKVAALDEIRNFF